MMILKKLIAGEHEQKKLQTNSSEKCGATDGEKNSISFKVFIGYFQSNEIKYDFISLLEDY